ncbi:MAG: ABC transporter ATP-binding protein [Gloeobacteraceae cyanobacterium ES-bin-144]|nr:ABC transporter ATP-binding protein [Verrucomicrobiales bacterium]
MEPKSAMPEKATEGAQPGMGTAMAMPGGRPPAAGQPEPEEISPFRFSVLWKFGRTYLKGHLAMVLFYVFGHLIVHTILPQQAAVYLGKLTNHFSSSGSAKDEAPGLANALVSEDLLTTYSFWIVFTVLLVAGGFGFQWLVARLDGKITNGIKADLFAKLLRQPPQYYHENDSDRLTMIVNQYSNQIAGSIRSMLIEPVLQVIGIIIIGLTIYQSLLGLTQGPAVWTILGINGVWVLFGATLLFALTSPWIVNSMGKYLQRDTSAVQEQQLGLATLVGGALKAPEEIQAMRAEPVFEKKLNTLLDRSLKLRMSQTMTMERINAFSQLPGTIVLAAFLGMAIYLEMKGVNGQPGTIVQVALLTPLLMGAIQQLSSFGINMRMSWPPMDMIHSILESNPHEETQTNHESNEALTASLEARDLVFSYRPGERPNVLEGASFVIPAGKVTGFVARPGQGKTTFFRLALRFYPWQSGDILLGGTPIHDLPLATVRRHLVLMSQFPAFFYDTVRENMLVACPDATDEDIRNAAALTGLDKVLMKSMGADALNMPFAAGAGLSGGQKKLFALTRCLLRKPSVLFLDEPTTGMGPMEKFPLIETMRRSLEGRTVVVVDHDIVWQSRFCDYFHVLNEGKIIQSGTAEELQNQPGLFRELYEEASGQGEGPSPAHAQSGMAIPSPAH